MTDHGMNIPSSAILKDGLSLYNMKSPDEREQCNEVFVEKFAKQIKLLIKREPRLVKKDDGGYTFF